MRRIEGTIEILCPLLGLLAVILFNYFFPSIKSKTDILLLIGFSLSIYGISLVFLSRYYTKTFREVPAILDKLRKSVDEITELREAEMILPAEVCLQQEQTVQQTVHVLTHDLSWNINEAGTPKLMFDTIAFNLRRGIRYEYVLVDASRETRDDLQLLRDRLSESLNDKPEAVDNFIVKYVENFPLLFSFALFDVGVAERDNLGFILVHTLEKPMAIPMNLATLKQARRVLNVAVAE